MYLSFPEYHLILRKREVYRPDMGRISAGHSRYHSAKLQKIPEVTKKKIANHSLVNGRDGA